MQKIFLFTLIVVFCFICKSAPAQSGSTLPKFADVVIDEILADPNPAVGLPDAEFIEIKNTSGKNISLGGWKLKSISTESRPFPPYILPADSFLIITGSSNTGLYTFYGNVLEIVSFPALNNSGTTLSLISKEGAVIHSVSYNTAWFQNDVKSSGGWSLEMTTRTTLAQAPATGRQAQIQKVARQEQKTLLMQIILIMLLLHL